MEFLEMFLIRILNMGITGGIVILFIFLIRALLFKAPRKYAYYLWGIALFRLLCPFSFSSEFSALNLVGAPASWKGEVEYVSMRDGGGRNRAREEALRAGTEGAKNQEQDRTAGKAPGAGTDFSAAGDGAAADLSRGLPAGAGTGKPAFSDREVLKLFCIWLSGAAALACCGAISAAKLRRKLACAARLFDNVYLADQIAVPLAYGLIYPRIYLPPSLGGAERDYVIMHEREHIRRRDPLLRAAAYLAVCLYWFHPLVWLAFFVSGKDMEMSCDEAVMQKAGRDIRAEYAGSLLALSVGKTKIAGLPPAFGEGDVKRRVRRVMRYRKRKAALAAPAAALCVFLSACLAANPAPRPESSEGKEGEEAPATDESFAAGADQAITKAVMEHNAERFAQKEGYDFACCSFYSLLARSAGESGEQEVTHYGWAYYAQYLVSEQGIEEVGGSHVPVALTFDSEGGGYRLKEYWEPGEGSDFVPDVKKKFPAEIAADGTDSQKFVLRQIQECYAQAAAYGNLDTDDVMESLLDEICSSPAYSSNPQDYIRAHEDAYRELSYYGDLALEYCMERFRQGEGTGLRGHVMARLCEELLDAEGKLPADAEEAPGGQEWYEALSAYVAESVAKEEEEILEAFGVPVELPQNESWIQNPNISYSDEGSLRIDYYDGILEGRCELRVEKDGKIDVPKLEEGRQADEIWTGETKSGQAVDARLYRMDRKVIVAWEYGGHAFAITGYAPDGQADASPAAKAALYVIGELE